MTLNPHRPGHDYVRGILDCCQVLGADKTRMLNHFRDFHAGRAAILDHDPIQKARALTIVTEIDKVFIASREDDDIEGA